MTVRRHAPSVRGRRVDDRVKGNRATAKDRRTSTWRRLDSGDCWNSTKQVDANGERKDTVEEIGPKTAEAKLHGEDTIMGRGRLQDAAQLAEHGRLQDAAQLAECGRLQDAAQLAEHGRLRDAAQLAEHGRLQDAARLAERIKQTNGLKLDTRKTEAL